MRADREVRGNPCECSRLRFQAARKAHASVFFFDVHDGTYARDEDGIELDGIDAARKQVWNTLPAMASQREPDGDMACQLRMDVRDESGKHLFHAALAFVIEPASD
jgi:hypothetical protein